MNFGQRWRAAEAVRVESDYMSLILDDGPTMQLAQTKTLEHQQQ